MKAFFNGVWLGMLENQVINLLFHSAVTLTRESHT